MAAPRRRLDRELVRRHLAGDLDEAARLVDAGRVLVGGAPAGVPARLVAPGEAVVVTPPAPPFVSRAGAKLDAALEAFGIDVAGRDGLDVGASTGGFTDCLLQRGAARVVALDVGHGLLHERLLDDPRVTPVERCNVRDLGPGRMGEAERTALLGAPAGVVVTDVSFISLRSIADALLACAAPDADLVLLVKPQFEATRAEADRGRGIITTPSVWRRVLAEVVSALEAHRAVIMGVMVSPVRGTGGNVEFALHVRHAGGADPGAWDGATRDARLDHVVAEAGAAR